MPREIIVHTRDQGASTRILLQNAWVYWKESGRLTILRTDNSGHLVTLRSGGNATYPWDYTRRYQANTGVQIEIFFSRGAKPIPTSLLNAHSGVFHQVTIPAGSMPTSVPTNPSTTTTVTVVPPYDLEIPNIIATLTKPTDLSLWPLLWELPNFTRS